MKRILLPTDFSTNARNAFSYILKMLGNDVEEYILLNSFEPPHGNSGMLISINDILQKESESGLKKEKQYLIDTFGIDENKIKTVSDLGDLVGVIERELEHTEIDMVVMGTKGASGLKEVLIGSNASAVIQNIFIPVLTVPDNWEFKSLNHIVFATDYVQNKGRDTFSLLLSLAEKNAAEVKLVNVKKSKSKVSDSERESERRNLAETFAGVEHSFESIESEDTVEGLHSYLTHRKDIDLLCMIPRKNNFFDKIFNRSVTNKIANLAHLPMLTLHDVE